MTRGQGRFIGLFHDIYDMYKDPLFLTTIVGAVQDYGYNFVTLQDCLSDASPYRATNGGATTTTQSTNGGAASMVVPSFMVPFVASLAALAL